MKPTEDKRAAIFQATLELIAEHGFHGAPISLIAKRANVSAGTIYNYFEDKDDLIHSLYEDLETKNHPFITEGYSEDFPFRERFFILCRNIYHHLLDNPQLSRFIEQYYGSPYGLSRMRQKLDSASEPFQQLFNTGKKQQIIRELPHHLLFCLTFSPLTSAVRDHHSGLFLLCDQYIEDLIEATWNAIKR